MTEEQLDELLSTPSDLLIQDLQSLKGDILILGVGGKMGPSLARLAVKAVKESGQHKKVFGVSRFSDTQLRKDLEATGVITIEADILEDNALEGLPDASNVIYMVGRKFGTSGQEHLTWAMNAYLPGKVAERYKNSKIVVFSSGNIYPMVPVVSGGATENTNPSPIGEYAQSCLGRERVFQYFSHLNKTPMLIYRLNYAVDLRYGNLLEIGEMVKSNMPIDLKVGHMNVIWQGDANEIALRALNKCNFPPEILNVTGPETVSIKWVAKEFGRLFKTTPRFLDTISGDCLLNNASKCHHWFGYPKVSILEMINMTAKWINEGGSKLNKPTHFQETKGNY
ncbi:NAD-dependent epimerase/dehydratase family protein [Pleomorphovibrio marinus]|uniref:NAD-dependent epimerase/dehydratase family protein n=1 Tax=Pleomorphovibrio marinus TaxID=2164132 RepID=UPI000E0B353A|nr:NAD-dependent epimerase/dehydratase family protein [Pleomorphovibrio marinus]